MARLPGAAPGTVSLMLEQASAPLAPLTTLRVGGPARRMVTATTEQEIVDTVKDCDRPRRAAADPGRRLQPADRRRRLRRHRAEDRHHRRDEAEDVLGPAPGRGGRPRLGRLRRRSGGPRRGRRRGPQRHPRLGGRDPDPERRRLRPGRRPDHRLDPGPGPRDRRHPRHAVPLSGVRLPRLGVQAEPGQVRGADGVVRLRPAGGLRGRAPVGTDPLCGTGARPRRRGGRPRPAGARSARRC